MSINQEELKQLIEMVCIERNLEYDEVIKAMEQAIASAYRKEFGDKQKSYEAKFNPESGRYTIFEVTQVVEEVLVPERELDLITARLHDPNAKLGDKIKKELAIDNQVEFGRIASQVARQVMTQSVSAIRHSKVLDKFRDRIGDIVSVEVDYFKRGGYIVKLGQTTGFISRENLLPIDRFKSGQIIKALIVDISEDNRGNSRILLSRSSLDFVLAVIRNEVPEVESGAVTIDKIVREPGSRSKLLVSSTDEEALDPVGTILGKKNVRITNIMREISSTMQEKIDLIENNPEDLELMVMDTLEPAEIERVEFGEENKTATVFVYPEEAALAVGRGGVNIKLAGELMDMEITIETLDEAEPSSGPEIFSLDDDSAEDTDISSEYSM